MSSSTLLQHQNENNNTLLFHQVNVGKGGTNTDIALQQAWESGAHIVMVQEPWTMQKDGEFITKSHPGYNTYKPMGPVGTRPRAISFVRKGLAATQIFPSPRDQTGDYCFVQVHGVTFVNVYRAPGLNVTLGLLLRWSPSGPAIVGGDFNAVSRHWQPQASRQYGNGDTILEWAAAHDMYLLNPIGKPTHRDGNVLDLVWSNTAAEASVSGEHDCTSDHMTIVGSIQLSRRPNQLDISQELRLRDQDLAKFAQYIRAWVKPGPMSSIRDIESQVSSLMEALGDARKAVGRKPTRVCGNSAPWWNEECKLKHREYKEARGRQENAMQARKVFKHAVKAAKRDYWRRQVENATTDAQVFKVMQWAKPKTGRDPPPLKVAEDTWISDPLERAEALRDTLLTRFDATRDLPTWESEQPESIPWDSSLSLEDVTASTLGTGDKSPGSDKITVRLLRACWSAIGAQVKTIFQACLEHEHFPSAFRVAEVILLPKPGRDLTTAKGWRPISLLSCLGKGLERLVAKRMAWLAIKHQVVPQQLFGALPGRSAVDLVSCVIHDVEAAMRNNKVTAMVTLDVQGAFDAVLHKRLLQRMRNQGWPRSLCRWVESFLTQRKIRVRHQDGITQDKVAECGVPQGSPLSPLLFLLYIAILVQQGNKDSKFGYADDIAVLCRGSSAAEAVANAQLEVERLIQLANEHEISFDPAKSDLLLIGGGSKKLLDTAGLAIHIQGRRIIPSPHVKWLGVWIDSQLNFKQHVQEWCGKAQRITQFIRRINTVQRGADPGPMIRAVQACVISTALYGSEAWWPGLTRVTTQRSKKVGTGVGWHTDILDSIIIKAVRAALPVWRTTPNTILHRESGIPPAAILLQQRQLRAAARIQRMDTWHPLLTRSQEGPKETISRLGLRAGQKSRTFTNPERYLTRLQVSLQNLPVAVESGNLFFPKAELKSQSTRLDKQTEAAQAKTWIANLSADTVCAYPDGSSCGLARSAWGYTLFRGRQMIGIGSGPLLGAEAYDAELLGAQKALEAAILVAGINPIKVLLDSSEASQALQSGRSRSFQGIVDKFVSDRQKHPSVEIRWIQGHSGIEGNEKADELAKAALKDLPDDGTDAILSAEVNRRTKFTFASLSRFVRERAVELAASWWQKHGHKHHADLNLKMTRKRPPELALPRWAYHRLIAARTGHGDFANYHERFKHEDIDGKCECGRERRPWHFAECRPALQRWRSEKREPPPKAREMLAENGWEKFLEFVTVTRCYSAQNTDREA